MSFLPPTSTRKFPQPWKFSSPEVFSAERIDFLRTAVAEGTLPSRLKTKWGRVAALPSSYTVERKATVWYFPENYEGTGDPTELLDELRKDLQAACGYAFRYLVNRNENDAFQAVRIIEEYSKTPSFETNAGSTLRWFEAWPLLIQTALMVKSSPSYTFTVDSNFKATTQLAINTLEPIAYTRPNNWASWGLVLEFSSALLFQDRPKFDRAVSRWYSLFDSSVVSKFLVQNGGPAQGQLKDNVAYLEIYRMGSGQGNGAYGLLYSSFHLDGMTIAAEWARIGGIWLYDHVAPDGSSLKGFWEEIAFQKRYGAPTLSADYLSVQWYNTSNLQPWSPYYYSGYYTNRVGGGFYILQQLWPLQTAYDLMNGGFQTVAVPPNTYPPNPAGQPSIISNGYGIAQDYYGMYGADLAYWGRPLYG